MTKSRTGDQVENPWKSLTIDGLCKKMIHKMVCVHVYGSLQQPQNTIEQWLETKIQTWYDDGLKSYNSVQKK